MSDFQWQTPGVPSRWNDRAYAMHALRSAIKALEQPSLMDALGRVGWAIDCTLALHEEAPVWREWAEANRGWSSLWEAVQSPPDRATARLLRAQMRQRMQALQRRVARAGDDEAVLSEAALIVDGALVEEGDG